MTHEKNEQAGTLSEGGSSMVNAEAAQGGADSVPDTPDGNERGASDSRASNVPGKQRRADGDLGVDGEE
ncbi:MAG: hypothetical protein Q4P07_09100 [Ornithinimicrobium sp.]|uniref:hypothetical protein n=1 Tax=Ornithinimicrobium sp. TaxID=1977084 RepID=UPI0026DEDE57|nr:hypothetical protein [Ornithinimicrobium sp.]MDO5740292.1 hypothetical protein [Ornithinimicrobium sp.]